MPFIPLKFEPGIYTEATAKDALNRWVDGLNVRWRSRKPEKMRGRQKASPDAFLGVCRGMNSWVALNGAKYLQIGTHRKLYIYSGGVFSDITPLRASTSAPFNSAVLNNPFDSAVGTSIVTVHHVNHDQDVGSFVSFSNATASPTDGTVIAGFFEVLTAAADSYTFDCGIVAAHSETGFGGAAVDYDYQIAPGLEDTIELFGYDSGAFDQGTYDNTGGGSVAVATATIWHCDTYGELGVANIHGGAGYTWDTSLGVDAGNVATLIENSPERINILKTDPRFRRLIALGCTDENGNFDPMLIRATNRESMTIWAFTDTNTVYQFRASGGSEIVGAVLTDTQFMVLTDTSANSLTPTFDEFEYQLTHLADGCGLIGPDAADQWNGKVLWMSQNNFFLNDGVVRVVECDLWSAIFDDLNLAQKHKFRVRYIAMTNEFRIYVATASSTEINKMYIYHPDDKWWSIGDFDDTAIISDSEAFPHPFGTTADGYLWEHETGEDNGTSPMLSSLRSYDLMLSQGEKLLHIRRLIPDFKTLQGSITIGMNAKKYQQGGEVISSPTQQIAAATKYASIRARGRSISIMLSTTALGDFWEMGDLTAEAYPHGRR